ncbi:MAG: hypothetical protein JSW06_01880 [Thermoplasmatales archaeon]|nr:MAG: hypothetical protein JSW06_01880 [Thermoplasmatales archaeon]
MGIKDDWPGIRLLKWCREYNKGDIMGEHYLSDNHGNRVPPHPDLSDPVLESGQVVVAGSKDTNATVTVTAGKSYAITSITGCHYFGLATTATAANCIWACGEGRTIVVKIPTGYTSLHYQTPSNSRKFILRRLKDTSDD